MTKRTITFILLALLLIAGIAPAYAGHAPADSTAAHQPAAGTVDGYVYLDGAPLAGVEVWVGEFGPGGMAASHYDCTDSSGYFEMTGVALDTDLVAVTGIEVYLAQPCDNPLFLDLDASPRPVPLLTNYWNNHSGIGPGDTFQLTAASPSASLTFNVERWPIERHMVLVNTLTMSIDQFHAGNTAQAVRMAERFIHHTERLERRGALTSADAAQITAYARYLIDNIYAIGP